MGTGRRSRQTKNKLYKVLMVFMIASSGVFTTGVPLAGSNSFLNNIAQAATNGWVSSGGYWYYYTNGVVATGWKKIDTSWYYFNPTNGAMATGWTKVGTAWYYFNPTTGVMALGWNKIGSAWYYFEPANESGATAMGWKQIGGSWYYFNPANESGAMVLGWFTIDGKRYYFDPTNESGIMVMGSFNISGVWHLFDKNGVWMGEAPPISSGSKVTVVNSSTVVSSDYEFIPQFITGKTTASTFGTLGSETLLGTGGAGYVFYFNPGNNTAYKGSFGVKYTNVGTYKGKQMDLKITVLDWNRYTNHTNAGISFYKSEIGMNSQGFYDIDQKWEFYESGTNTLVPINGYITISDLDWNQHVKFPSSTMSYIDRIMVDPSAVGHLFYETSGTDTVISSSKELTDTYDLHSMITVLVRNTSQLRFSWGTKHTNLTVPDKTFLKPDEGGDAFSYTAKKPARTELITPKNWISNGSNLVTSKIIGLKDTITFVLEQQVPDEWAKFYYSNFVIEDQFSKVFNINNVRVEDQSGADVTSYFTKSLVNNKLVLTAPTLSLNSLNFYNKNYKVYVTATVNEGELVNLTSTNGVYTVLNTFKTTQNSSSKTSNQVEVYVGNRAPVANFSTEPSIIFPETIPTFTNLSTDPDGNSLTYKWEYKEPNSSTWVNFSTSSYRTTKMLNIVGSWGIRLTATDSYGLTNQVEKSIPVVPKNPALDTTPPTIKFRNKADTEDFLTQDWKPRNLTVRVVIRDTGTGFKRYRFAYTQSINVPTEAEWVSNGEGWIVADGVSRTAQGISDELIEWYGGQWYLHVQAEDWAGNSTYSRGGVYKVNDPPTVDFIYSPTTIYDNTTVQITNNSTDKNGHSLVYQWEYQEPNSSVWVNWSSLKDPSKVFNKDGIWNVRLTATDGIESSSITKTVNVTRTDPIADFSWTPDPTDKDTEVQFKNQTKDADGDVLTYQWAYQEPGTSTWVNFSNLENPRRIFNKKGSWGIRLTASDGKVSNTKSKTLVVSNRTPIASFVWTPDIIYNNTSVTLTNTSIDPDGDALTYSWELKEPSSLTWVKFSTVKDVSKVFSIKGDYMVRLTVSDGELSNSVTNTITVKNRAPVASFTYTPSTVYNSTAVNFTNTSTDPDGDALTKQWSLQRPNSLTWENFSIDNNPTKVLNEKGVWKVKLTVTDLGGLSSSTTQSITVGNRTPIADFSVTPNPTNRVTTATFKDNSRDDDGDFLSYSYRYRIKGTSTWVSLSNLKEPTFKFPTVNTYEVELTVTDTSWLSNSIIKEVQVVNLSPLADFTVTLNTSNRLTAVNFTNKSTDPENDSLTYKYEYRKKATTSWLALSSEANPSFKFSEIGVFEVRLTVTDSYGAQHSIIREVTINNLSPTSNFTIVGSSNLEGGTLKATNTSIDPEGDTLTPKWTVIYPNGVSGVFTTWDLAIPNSIAGVYNITLEVTDLYGDRNSITKTTQVTALTINSKVSHTPQWKTVHEYNGNTELQFYSGESFELESSITNYPISRLRVTLTGYNITSQTITEAIDLTDYVVVGDYRKYIGSLFKDWMSNPVTRLRNGQVTFRFEVTYTNGIVKSDSVNIEIIDTVYKTYDFHRTN